MKVRSVTKADIEQLVQLFDQYRQFYRKKSDLGGAKGFLTERLENEDSKIYTCENDKGQLMGFVQLYPLFSSTRMKKFWLLNDLFVNASFRGQGVSIQLIERAKQLVRDTDACGMYLETEKTNTIGNKLYPRVGFEFNDYANFYEWNNQ